MTQVIRLFAYLVAMRLVVCLLVCWSDACEFGFGVCMLLLRIAWRVGWGVLVLEFGVLGLLFCLGLLLLVGLVGLLFCLGACLIWVSVWCWFGAHVSGFRLLVL